MTTEEKNKCHIIIHAATAASGAGNLVPIPGLGAAADMVTMTTMAISLASVFGEELTHGIKLGGPCYFDLWLSGVKEGRGMMERLCCWNLLLVAV